MHCAKSPARMSHHIISTHKATPTTAEVIGATNILGEDCCAKSASCVRQRSGLLPRPPLLDLCRCTPESARE